MMPSKSDRAAWAIAWGAALAILMVNAAPVGAEERRILDLATLQEIVVGRRLESSGGSTLVTIKDDGTLSGIWNNERLDGNWQFRDGFFCRTVIVDTFIGDDCQIMTYDDGGITIIRAKGTGERVRYLFRN